MTLPEPPPLSALALSDVLALCEVVFDLIDEGLPVPPTLLREFSRLTGREFPPEALAGVSCREDFAVWALTPIPRPLPQLPQATLIEMVYLLQRGGLPHRTLCYWLELLGEILEDPCFAELIFWPVRRLTPPEVLVSSRRRRGSPQTPGFPGWLFHDDETWGMTHERAGRSRGDRIQAAG